jgi:hypothetical protein
MPLAGNDQRKRASAHYKWADRYSRYGDARRSMSHFGRALHYESAIQSAAGQSNFGVRKSNCDEGKRCKNRSDEHATEFSHDCEFGPRCTRKNDHHIATMHLLNLHRATGLEWSVTEHYGRCGQSCGCCAVYVDGPDSGNCEMCSYARLRRDAPQPGFTKDELELFHKDYTRNDPPLKKR